MSSASAATRCRNRGRGGLRRRLHHASRFPAHAGADALGTLETVKSVSMGEVRALGAEMVLAKPYHPYRRPGHDPVRKSGGLSEFMRRDGPTLTGPGGFPL